MTRWTGKGKDGESGLKHIVDFNLAREQRLAEKRKNTERIFFKNLVSVYTVMGKGEIFPIELIDVSEDGCSFQIPLDVENDLVPKINSSDLPIRLYFSQDTYLEIRVQVQNSRQSIDSQGRYIRYGCLVDKTLKSYPAFQQFVRFLSLYSEHAHRDMGDMSVFYL